MLLRINYPVSQQRGCSFFCYPPQKGELLLSKKHPASGEVREQLSRLLQLWEELLDALHRRGRGLEEAQDMLDFESQVDKVEAWIRDKVRVWLCRSQICSPT